MVTRDEKHFDAGSRCCVYHKDGGGACILCSCGAWVRDGQWWEHLLLNQKEFRSETEGRK